MPSHIAAIRPAEAAQAPVIADFLRAVWEEHYPAIIGHAQVAYMLTRRADPAVVAGELAQGIRYDCVTATDGAILALVSHAAGDGPLAQPGDWKIRQLYIRQDQRGCGLGRRLVEQQVAPAAAAHGCTALILTVNKGNHRALAAYAAWGFTTRGGCVVDIGRGFVMDDWVLERPLAASPRPPPTA